MLQSPQTTGYQRRAMAGYDAQSIIMTATPNVSHNVLRLSTPSNNRMEMLGSGMDAFDHDLNFEGDGGLLEDPTHGLSMPFTPSYDLADGFSSTFEDPFSYQSATDFSAILDSSSTPTVNPHNNDTAGGSSEGNVDNKLLSFGAPILKAPMLDNNGGQIWPQMSAELYGMFFVAEDVFGDNTTTTTGRPMELTCYRRNLFQISGTITLSRGIKTLVNEQGQQIPLYDLMVTLSALESIEGKQTEIISVPWKTSTGTSEDKSGAAPPKWPLDLSMNPELDPIVVSIPIAWKRLQFKHATANNGRRKGLQQHYIIQINLIATLATGEVMKLAEIRSGAIIVRGRSPRNFDSRKDVPVNERKTESKSRTVSDSASSAVAREASVKADPGVTNGSYKFYALNALQQPLDLPDWTNPSNKNPIPSPSFNTISTDTLPRKKPALAHQSSSSSSSRPPFPQTKWKSEISPNKSLHMASPIDLSIADEDYGKAHPDSRGSHPRSIGDSSPIMERRDVLAREGKKVASPSENADLLYEYFPLSLDDWMPPVDAIYRPHVVHHTVLPPELKAEQMKNKTKRYFSAED